MANLSTSNHSSSSSNYYRKSSVGSPSRRSNTMATAYAVDASTMALTGFHFTHGFAGGAVPLGVPSPPPSPEAAPIGRPVRRPSLQLQHRKRSGDAACHITEECERLFCETLKSVFLVEKNPVLENSLVMDMPNTNTAANATASRPIPQHHHHGAALERHGQFTPLPSPDGRIFTEPSGLVRDYVEVWDYVAGAGFKGFVAEKDDERTLFVFFGKQLAEVDLKPGLMSLLELAGTERFDCSKLVIGLSRDLEAEEAKDLTRDLGWVGFELTMLDEWTHEENSISDRWVFMGMDI